MKSKSKYLLRIPSQFVRLVINMCGDDFMLILNVLWFTKFAGEVGFCLVTKLLAFLLTLDQIQLLVLWFPRMLSLWCGCVYIFLGSSMVMLLDLVPVFPSSGLVLSDAYGDEIGVLGIKSFSRM